MANYHSDSWIMTRVSEHFREALKYFDEDNIIGIFLFGSQNYGLDTENSDIDTRVLITPTVENLAQGDKLCSTTHIRENNEHIEFKDIRLCLETFRKQNVNALEILFTPYCIINPKYEIIWKALVANREQFARFYPYKAIKTMEGLARRKYDAMEHQTAGKAKIFEQYGYDPKELHHLYRIKLFMMKYINGYTYQNCLQCSKELEYDFLQRLKNNPLSLEEARHLAEQTLNIVLCLAEAAADQFGLYNLDTKVIKLLNQAQIDFIYEGLRGEFK